MAKAGKIRISITVIALISAGVAAMSLSRPVKDSAGSPSYKESLTGAISEIVSGCPGETGVAVIIGSTDTVTVMMSVFKVHQALAVCNAFDRSGQSLDTMMTIRRDALDPETWSPMMKEHPEPVIRLTVKDLMRYSLIWSDNNASNFMFSSLVSVPGTDSFIATLIPRSSFRIAYSESEMAADHSRAYSNTTSPLGAAELMDRLFTDSLVSREKQDFIKEALRECTTGKDRIAAPLTGKEGVGIAHKTGSGYSENGVLAAHNDVAYISLPDGTHYTLAVFVKDFRGSSRISEALNSRPRKSSHAYQPRSTPFWSRSRIKKLLKFF